MTSSIDWRILAVMTALGWGVQAPLAKWVMADLGWRTTFFYVFIGFVTVPAVLFLARPSGSFGVPHGIALLSGVVGALGSWAFYKAMERVELSALVPLTAQYVLVSAVLGIIFLHEKLTPTKIAGIALSIVAVILLSLPAEN